MRPVVQSAVLVTRYFPYPQHTGALIYSAQLIGVWAKLSRALDVFCAPQHGSGEFRREAGGTSGVVFHLGEAVAVGAVGYLLRGMPKAAAEFATGTNRSCLTALLLERRPDVIVLDHLGSSWALPVVQAYRRRCPVSPQLVYVTHNEETGTRLSVARRAGLLRGLPHYFDAWRVADADRRVLAAASFSTCITEADRLAYTARGAARLICVPPIYTGTVRAERPSAASPGARTVALVGSFLWSAKMINLRNFLREACPVLARHGVSLKVIGRMRERDRLALQAAYPDLSVVGEVGAVEPFLEDARIGLLIDDAGGGFKLTGLTYAMNRVPVAALRSALSEEDWLDSCIVAGSFPGLIQSIVDSIDDDALLDRLQERLFAVAQRYRSDAANLGRMRQALAQWRSAGES